MDLGKKTGKFTKEYWQNDVSLGSIQALRSPNPMDIIRTGVLVTYFTILTILSIYGAHRLWMLLLYYRHRKDVPQPKGGRDFEPMVTVQLAVFNEMNVIERLMDAVVRMDWPKEKLEIQVLDDSTDETVKVAQAVCEKYR